MKAIVPPVAAGRSGLGIPIVRRGADRADLDDPLVA
jgi:hypothetical protein